jgi:hypothetical protein
MSKTSAKMSTLGLEEERFRGTCSRDSDGKWHFQENEVQTKAGGKRVLICDPDGQIEGAITSYDDSCGWHIQGIHTDKQERDIWIPSIHLEPVYLIMDSFYGWCYEVDGKWNFVVESVELPAVGATVIYVPSSKEDEEEVDTTPWQGKIQRYDDTNGFVIEGFTLDDDEDWREKSFICLDGPRVYICCDRYLCVSE